MTVDTIVMPKLAATTEQRPLSKPQPRIEMLQPVPRKPVKTRRRNMGPRALFLLLVILPALAMAYYSMTTTQPIFASEASIAIRSRSGSAVPTSGFGNILASFGIGQDGTNDVYVVRNYLQSHDMLSHLDKTVGYRGLVSAPQRGDVVTALPIDASTDDALRYFRSMVQIKLSTIEQIITFKAQSYSPNDARSIAAEMIKASEAFVNQLNERASQDQLKYAETNVRSAEKAVAESRLALNKWRNQNASINPEKQLEMLQTILTSLEGELAKTRAEIKEANSLPNAAVWEPRRNSLRAKEEALVSQIARERSRLTGSNSTVANQMLGYEKLSIDRDLAEKSYSAAILSLETARQEAAKQNKYVVTISEPSLPQDRSFPLPLYHTAVTALAGLVLWGIVLLLAAVIRDYRMPTK